MSSQLAHESHWRDDGTCSYCGSVKADTLFAAIASGAQVTPTDKNYKIYVDVPNPRVGQQRVVSSRNFDEGDNAGWISAEEARTQGFRVSDGVKWVQIEPERPIWNAKFYFQHLTEDERQRFVELMNSKAIKLAYPGHFYTLPFFAHPVGR